MKKVLLAAAAVMALPAIAEAQDVQTPGVYIGVEGGLNWLFNTTILGANVSPQTGWALGGKIGYDFIGPRIEVEGLYRQNQTGQFFGNRAINGQISQVSAMANFLYIRTMDGDGVGRPIEVIEEVNELVEVASVHPLRVRSGEAAAPFGGVGRHR